jgi:predicted N-acetyltransferase YhbS
MTFEIRHEILDDAYAIEQIVKNAFGPGRFAKTAYRLREAHNYNHLFGFVTENHLGKIVATIRVAPLKGYDDTVILGPIAVDSHCRNMGLGMSLMHKAEYECARYPNIKRIILVGDPDYYNRFGFVQKSATDIIFPAPVNKNRVLGKYLGRVDRYYLHGA